MHAIHSCHPRPRSHREPSDTVLLLPATIIVLVGLVALVWWIADCLDKISAAF